MAPLTRCRAPNNVPVPDMAVYYGQRASKGGLIISEATAICDQARGYPQVPGIYTSEQVEAWKSVVQAVHDKGGLLVCQLWHVGRASHPDYQPGNAAPVSASPIAIGESFEVYTSKGGPFKYPVPRALETNEIADIVRQYADAAKNAIDAGFDGVEIHGANGYLLDQFWKDSSNRRTDEYGGSDENKARLLLEVMEAVAAAVGPERVGLRLSPYNTFLDACDTVERAVEKNTWLMKALDHRVPGLAYMHMVEPRLAGGNAEVEGPISHSLEPFRQATSLPFLAAGGFKREDGIKAVGSGHADAVVYGRWFISNPDLPKRLALGAPLTPYNRDTFYSFGTEGYTDYPLMEDQN
eukprot:GHUV01022969.1.p1 GENE.GHUV01022969.1~~GHUV01022969.1.p1  ORF type:complete len:352 (+),score=70.28 GHUV01022969.1:604-1659(+)